MNSFIRRINYLNRRNISLNNVRMAYNEEGKTTLNILNKDTELGLMINGYSQLGFRLNNDVTVLGPMIIFPRSVLSWKVNSIEEVCDDALSIFPILEPKLDIIVLGVGDRNNNFNIYKNILAFSKKHRMAFEILPTEQACATYNFLNSEGRNVVGALIPPKDISYTDDDEMQTKLRYQNLYNS